MTTYTCTRCGHTSRYPEDEPPTMCPMCMGTMEEGKGDEGHD